MPKSRTRGSARLPVEPQIMRMFHGCYPGSEQTDESPTNALETQQQEGKYETPGRYRRPIACEVPWIAGDQAHQEDQEGEDCSSQRSGQEAEPTTDGYSPDNHPNHKASE